VQVDDLGGGQPGLVAEQLRQVAHGGAGERVVARPTEQHDLAGVGRDQA
jgi:hypothetical protein